MALKRRLDPKMLNNLRSFIHKQFISKTCQLVALCKLSEHMNCRLASFVYKEINKQIGRFWFPNHWTGRYVRRPRFVTRRLVTWRHFFLEPFYDLKNHPPTYPLLSIRLFHRMSAWCFTDNFINEPMNYCLHFCQLWNFFKTSGTPQKNLLSFSREWGFKSFNNSLKFYMHSTF